MGIVELGEATVKLSQPPTLAGGEGSAGPVEPPSPLVLRVEVTTSPSPDPNPNPNPNPNLNSNPSPNSHPTQVTMVGATVLVHL